MLINWSRFNTPIVAINYKKKKKNFKSQCFAYLAQICNMVPFNLSEWWKKKKKKDGFLVCVSVFVCFFFSQAEDIFD